jgi:hypothetical protein
VHASGLAYGLALAVRISRNYLCFARTLLTHISVVILVVAPILDHGGACHRREPPARTVRTP